MRGLEFNPSVSNLLASGAGESDVFITDLSNPGSPSVYSPGAKSSGPPSDISSVAWNRKVQHILASTSHSGLSVVWDLKLKKPVISFQDPNNKTQRNSVITWNPEAATEVLVASADDRSPVLQIWDLRNATMPVRELHGHTKGILAASWCPHDSNLLLSSGNDSRTICWDVSTGDMVCELPSTTRPTFDVQWSPRLPAILSASSFDGIVSVYSLQDASSVPTPASAEGFLPQQSNLARPVRAPKWLKRPCGATFGFGGQLSLFNEAAGVSVTTVDVVSDPAVVDRSQQLEQALELGSEGLGGFCAAKAGTTSARDATEWRLMQVLCSSEQRRLLLGFLGLAEEPPPEVAPPSAPATPSAMGTPGAADDDPAALFSQLAVATEEQEAAAAARPPPPAEPPADDAATLSRAMLGGNLEAAVACCLRAGRMADALVLAASGGPELWTATRDQYLQSSSTPFMQTLSAIVHQDFARFVNESDLASWKETLGLVNTYSSAEELGLLCNQLGERLEAERGDSAAATLCYMCAANIAKVTALWQSHHSAADSGATAALLDLIEKLVVFQEAAQSKQGYALVADKVVQFAELLASQGCLHPAMKYLLQLPLDDPTSPAAVLMDRLYHRDPSLLTGPPPTPFEHVHVQVSQSVHAAAQAAYEQQQQQQYAQQQQQY